MSEKKFEECLLQDATHIEVNGKMYKIGSNEVVLKYHNDCIGLRWEKEDAFISLRLFPILNIKPLKEVKPEPIEFEATFFKYDGKWRTLYLGDNHLPYENCKVAKFKCVEILEDEE